MRALSMSGDLERDDLGRAQARPIGHAQRRLVLEARRRIQETRHLLRAQNDRQPPRLPDERQMDHESGRPSVTRKRNRSAVTVWLMVGTPGRRSEDQMQLIAAQILEARRVRRAPRNSAEALDGADVVFLRLRRELADRHIFDHAPAQRADRSRRSWDAPV